MDGCLLEASLERSFSLFLMIIINYGRLYVSVGSGDLPMPPMQFYCSSRKCTQWLSKRSNHRCGPPAPPANKSQPPNNLTERQRFASTPSGPRANNKPYTKFLFPVFNNRINPFEPSLYKGQAKEFPGENIDIKVRFFLFRFPSTLNEPFSTGSKRRQSTTLRE